MDPEFLILFFYFISTVISDLIIQQFLGYFGCNWQRLDGAVFRVFLAAHSSCNLVQFLGFFWLHIRHVLRCSFLRFSCLHINHLDLVLIFKLHFRNFPNLSFCINDREAGAHLGSAPLFWDLLSIDAPNRMQSPRLRG